MGPRQFIADQLLARRTSSELCTSESSSVRTRRRNLRFVANASASLTTSFVRAATRSCRRNEPQKSSMRLGTDPLTGSSRDLRRTVRSKAHSAQASPEKDTKERVTLRLVHTWSTHSSGTAHPSDDTRCSHSWLSAETTLGNSPCRCH